MRTIETTIDIDADPAQVWSTLIDFPSHADWNPFFASITGEPTVGQQLRVTARSEDGSPGLVFKPTVLVAEPGRLLRWRGRLFLPRLFDGTHEFHLEPLAGGRTRLIHREEFQGVLVPFLGGVLRDTNAGFERFNQALADEVTRRLADNTEPADNTDTADGADCTT